MERTLRDREILQGIRDLSSKRATGKLQITIGMTQGAIFFDKGQIVDANLGKLNGFQAINAIASIPDGTFDFDPSISPPVQHLNFSERLVLTKAFGLTVQSEPKYSPPVNEPSDDAPVTAILLNDVEERPNSDVLQVETEPVFERSSLDPAAAVISDSDPLITEEQPHSTYYSNDDDIIPASAPSKWSVLKAFFGLKVRREPEYSPAVNEPFCDTPATAILLNDVEQPNTSVGQVETEPVVELSSVDPAAAVISATTPLNTDEQPHSTYYSAIFVNDIEDQPNGGVVQVETEPVFELSSVDPAAAVTSDTTPLNADEQPLSSHYSNDEDIIRDYAPSKWSVLKAFFGRKVHHELEYSPVVNEPSDDALTPAILLNGVEDQPNTSVVDAQPMAQVETEPVFELSSVEPAAAVISDSGPLNTEEHPPTYYSNDEDIPDNSSSKLSALKAFFGRKVQREAEYSLAANEPSDGAPATAILLNDIEEQPNSIVVDAQPMAQVETEPAIELSTVEPAATVISDTAPLNTEEAPTYYSNDEASISDKAPSKWSVLKSFFGRKVVREPEYSPAVNEPFDDARAPAILLNDIEDQPNTSVLDPQPIAQVEIEPVFELSSVDPAAAVISDSAPLNTEEQPHTTHYSNAEDTIPDKASSKWSVVKAFFGRKVQREPEYLPAVNESFSDAPAPASLLNRVEEQPNSDVVQVEPLLELSSVDPAAVISDTTPLNTDEQPLTTHYSNDEDVIPASAPSKWSALKHLFGRKVQPEPEYSPALNEPSDDAPAPAILLNDVEDQPNSCVVQVEIEPVLELSSVDPAAVTSDTTPLNTEGHPPTYDSNDEDIIPDKAPSKWMVLKAFFGRKVVREPEDSPAVNEPFDEAPAPAILLNDVEDQPNSSVLDAQPIAQVETEPVLELLSLEYLQALDGPPDNRPTEAIFLNDVEDQSNSSVLDAQPTIQVDTEHAHELSSVDPAAVTSIATRLNADEQLLTTHYSNHEDSIPDGADEVEVISGIAHRNNYGPVIFYQPASQLRLRPTFVAAVLGILLGVISAAMFFQSRELSLQHPPVVQTSSLAPANVPATQTPGFSSEVVSAAPVLTGKRLKVSENRQSFTRARRAPIEVKRSVIHTKRPLIVHSTPRREKVASTLSPSSRPSPSPASIARQSATPYREPVFRPSVAPAAAPQPRSDSNVLKRGASASIRGVRVVSSRVGSWVGSVFGKKKRSAQ